MEHYKDEAQLFDTASSGTLSTHLDFYTRKTD